MPALAERYTVIAPDLRGSGGSDAPESGYDKATLAEDVHQLLVALGLEEQVNVVGTRHRDHGCLRLRGRSSKLNTAPGATGGPSGRRDGVPVARVDPDRTRLVELRLFHARQRAAGEDRRRTRRHLGRRFRGLDGTGEGWSGRSGNRRVRAGSATPGYLHASYEYFKTFPRDVQDTIRNRSTTLTMPVLAVGAEGALGELVPEQAQKYADDVTSAVVPGGHWIAEEVPEILLGHLLPFLDK